MPHRPLRSFSPLFAAVLAVGLTLPAQGEIAEPHNFLRLTAPAADAVLPAGGLVALAWEPGPDLERFPRAHEWEAFLSVDGGATFPFRITPHLDLSQQRVLIRLPHVETPNARILLRVGDEREERTQPVSPSWSIRTTPVSPILLPKTTQPVASRGEAARPGDPGVGSWVEQGADGIWVFYQTASSETAWSTSPVAPPHHSAAVLNEGSRACALAPVRSRNPAVTALRVTSWVLPTLLRSRPILILVQRFNE